MTIIRDILTTRRGEGVKGGGDTFVNFSSPTSQGDDQEGSIVVAVMTSISTKSIKNFTICPTSQPDT